MPRSLVLFDVDGTLIDTARAGRFAIERSFHRVFGIDGVSARAAGVEYAGRTDPAILEDTALAIGVTPELYRERREEIERRFLDELSAEMRRVEPRRRVLPGVLPLLCDLDARDDVWLGLVTGNLEAGARTKLEPFGLNRFFPSGGFASDHPDRRQIARIAHERLSALAGVVFPPSRVTVVGDTELDVDCAKANGFRSVAVDYGWASRASLERAAPDHLLDDLGDRERTLRALGLGAGPREGTRPRKRSRI
jgi:phosphoglycolate phosphatase